jgi:hypothetical protein
VDGRTLVSASVPATSTIIVTWRGAAERPFVISRAAYSGELHESALLWTGRFQVEVFDSTRFTLPIMPSGVTLSDIRVDGEAATVLEEGGFFATLLQGRGAHEIEVEFQVPVIGDSGPPRASLQIPRIPVSRFDLVLPGSKQVTVVPGADVISRDLDGTTQTTAFIPMSDQVVFTWTEAVPEDLRAARPRHRGLRDHPRRDQPARPGDPGGRPGQPDLGPGRRRLRLGRGGFGARRPQAHRRLSRAPGHR